MKYTISKTEYEQLEEVIQKQYDAKGKRQQQQQQQRQQQQQNVDLARQTVQE